LPFTNHPAAGFGNSVGRSAGRRGAVCARALVGANVPANAVANNGRAAEIANTKGLIAKSLRLCCGEVREAEFKRAFMVSWCCQYFRPSRM
jgi:hypothetical protein